MKPGLAYGSGNPRTGRGWFRKDQKQQDELRLADGMQPPRYSKALRANDPKPANDIFKSWSKYTKTPSLRDATSNVRSKEMQEKYDDLFDRRGKDQGNDQGIDRARLAGRFALDKSNYHGSELTSDQIARKVAKYRAKVAEKQKGGYKLRAQRKHEARLKFDQEHQEHPPRVATPEESERARSEKERFAREKAARIVAAQRERNPPPTSQGGSDTNQSKALKTAGVGLLAVGGTAAAALGVRHIMKKRAERKRREREEEAKRKAYTGRGGK